MKKLIIALLILAPGLSFAQKYVPQDIKISQEAKMLPTETASLSILDNRVSDIIKMPEPPKEKEFWINCGCNKGKNALVLIDGIEGNLDTLDLHNIETFKVLKGNEATELYGEAGKDGVVLVTTKEYEKKLQEEKEEYEVVVLTPGYDAFLSTQKSKEFYTESLLKSKNIQMVKEWNFRYNIPTQYSSDIYEVSIDYDSEYAYGLEFEYRLHMFFRFMEKEHNMSLIGDRLAAKM